MQKFIKVFKPEIKGIDENQHIVDAIVSSKKVDRDGDIVMPDAFAKGLKSYKEHPVLLSSHNYSDLRKQIGEAISIKVTEEGLETKFKYFVGGDIKNEEAEWAWVLAKKGVSAYSIGFIAKEFDWMKIKDADGTERITGRRFTNVELLEISQVLVPSNRDALQSRRSLATEEVELCELAIKSFDKGELINVDVTGKTGEPHYTDTLLGDKGLKPILPPQEEVGIEDIKQAVVNKIQPKEK